MRIYISGHRADSVCVVGRIKRNQNKKYFYVQVENKNKEKMKIILY